MLLLERVKLRRLSSNPSLDDLKIFTITCCGTLVTIYCMKIPPGKDKSGELLSFEMEGFRSFSLISQVQIINMANVFNRIHAYGRTVHLRSILEDIEISRELEVLPTSISGHICIRLVIHLR